MDKMANNNENDEVAVTKWNEVLISPISQLDQSNVCFLKWV